MWHTCRRTQVATAALGWCSPRQTTTRLLQHRYNPGYLNLPFEYNRLKADDYRPGSLWPDAMDSGWICARYESVRHRLPRAEFPTVSAPISGLLDVADEFDAFLLDAFGVLNVGNTAIPGAPETVAALQAAGKAVLVLTNGATYPASDALDKYRAWGYRFDQREVIASRELVETVLRGSAPSRRWGVAGPAESAIDRLPATAHMLSDDPSTYSQADGFVFMSRRGWNESRQALLQNALSTRPRPLLVANPDVASPRETGFSPEPGLFSHLLAELPGADVRFYGKPFGNIFEVAFERLRARGVSTDDPRRIAMVGDSLHTDILGGAAAGCRTVLVSAYGLFRGEEYAPTVAATGIVPDFVSAAV